MSHNDRGFGNKLIALKNKIIKPKKVKQEEVLNVSAKDADQLLKELELKLFPALKNDLDKGLEKEFYDHIDKALKDIHDIMDDASVIYKRDARLELDLLKQLKSQILSLVGLHKEFEEIGYPDKEIVDEIRNMKKLAYNFFKRIHDELNVAYSATYDSDSLQKFAMLRSNYAHRVFLLSRKIKRKINTEKRDYMHVVSDEDALKDLAHHKKLKAYKDLERRFHDHVHEFQKIALNVFSQIDESMRYDTLLLLSVKHDLHKFLSLKDDANKKGYSLDLGKINEQFNKRFNKHFDDDFKMHNEELKEALKLSKMMVSETGNLKN